MKLEFVGKTMFIYQPSINKRVAESMGFVKSFKGKGWWEMSDLPVDPKSGLVAIKEIAILLTQLKQKISFQRIRIDNSPPQICVLTLTDLIEQDTFGNEK